MSASPNHPSRSRETRRPTPPSLPWPALRASLALAAALALAVGASACANFDRHPERPVSASLAPSAKGVLADSARLASERLPAGQSAFHLVAPADEALLWRLALADHATQSIDIQYYLWNTDETGLLLLSRLLDAADRGVRVRLLVDDFLFRGEEETLAALCHHPMVEIRMYNPMYVRDGGLAGAVEILARFQRLNRRMHNKAFIVDGRFVVIGGRNIGNEYFGLSETYNFVDLDVLAAGPVVAEAAESFDRYWNTDLAHPGEAFATHVGPEATAEAVEAIRRYVRDESRLLPGSPYPKARRDWSGRFAALAGRWHTGPAFLVDDAPTAEEETGERFLGQTLSRIGDPAEDEFLFATPYLIPGREVHQTIRSYVDRGVEVRLLTASLAANNHLIVHSHYRQHRRALLRHGLRLHEMREDAGDEVRSQTDAPPVRSETLALHVKAGVGDRSRCFIGSLNLDPRSIDLNTENGLVIESPGLAAELADFLETLMDPGNAWEVTQERGGGLRWESRGETRRIQPAPGGGVRVKDFLLGLLPIQHLL